MYSDTKNAELRLFTCGGTLDRSAHTYRGQTVVQATKVRSLVEGVGGRARPGGVPGPSQRLAARRYCAAASGAKTATTSTAQISV